jgi:glycosyltransferase involved in cell wall biosynthesis
MGTMFSYILNSIPKALGRIRSWKPDVIHVHFAVPTGAAAWVVSVLTGVPYVITAHLGDVPGGVPEKTGKWFRFVYPFTPPIWKRAKKVAAVSAFTREIARKHYDVPIDVIYNGVDLKTIDPGVIKVNDPPRIIFAGRFMEQKNPLLFVRTLGKLADLPWTCAMVGDGPLWGEVEAEIKRLEIEDRFILPGWVTPEEVLEWYHRGDILFMPSRSEGLPVVGVQAVAMGLAPVMSRVGGCVDIIDSGVNGYLVEPGDEAGFEAALRGLLLDVDMLYSFRLASRELAGKFDLDIIVESYVRLFKAAVGEA